MASLAFLSVSWCRPAVAWVRNRVLSALVIAGFLAGRDRFERGDDAFQAVLHLAEAGGQAGLAAGAGDQAQVDRGLAAVGVEEFRGGLEVGAGQAPLTELTTMFQQFMAGFRLLALICPRDRIG